jgi:hypothetical protein
VKKLLLLCLFLWSACPTETKIKPLSQPSSEATSGPTIPPKSPLLAPLGEGLGSETRTLLRFVPAEAQLIFLADVERLIKGPLWKPSEGFLKKMSERPEVVEFVKETNFQPIRDIRGAVVVMGDSTKEKTPSLLLLKARFDAVKLSAYLEKLEVAKDGALFLFARGSAMSISGDILLLGDPDMVRAASQQTTEALAPFLREMLSQLDPARPFSLAFQLTSATRASLELPPEFDGARGIAGWLDLSAGLEAKAFLQLQTAEQARLIIEDIERTWPTELQALEQRKESKYFEKLSFSQDEAQIKISWELPAGDAILFFTDFLGVNLEEMLKAYRVEIPQSQPQSTSAPASSSAPTSTSALPAR